MLPLRPSPFPKVRKKRFSAHCEAATVKCHRGALAENTQTYDENLCQIINNNLKLLKYIEKKIEFII